ncbi:MAG: phosphotransferase [Erythrobacter sp.]
MSDEPEGLEEAISRAGWAGAAVHPLPGDASFRRYFRLRRDNGEKPASAMLMHAPPPEEDPAPFLHVAHWLEKHGMRGPRIYFEDAGAGWVLLEDFGDDRMRDWLDRDPEAEQAAYETAVDALVDLHQRPPGPFPPYDMDTYLREAGLLTQWYAPAKGLDVDRNGYEAAWREVLSPLLARQAAPVTVLRDYHAENIMLLADPRASSLASVAQGLIDFQDALAGHRAYDLASLLQDARRDVSEALEAAMLERYCERAVTDEHFRADYIRLAAQRNAKIIGIFTRLYKRDGKTRYLDLIPRVWGLLERDLADPVLEPVAHWFAANIPENLRSSGGGSIL